MHSKGHTFYMITEVYQNIFQIQVPLPDTPLKVINSYFIRGKERNLLIDTAFQAQVCLDTFQQAMDQLDFAMENTDLFITHAHSDHCGLAGTLSTNTNLVYCSQDTYYSVTDQEAIVWEYYDDMIVQSGLGQADMSSHPGYKYSSTCAKRVALVEDGTVLLVGDYHLICKETSGHAPGHMCLFEEAHGLLFSGDHILATITPNNTLWDRPWKIQRDLLGEYLDNLDKIGQLPIQLTLPAHRDIITDCSQRIEELKAHHEVRLNAILDILGEHEALHGAQIASKMHWRIRARNWDEFPDAQKVFATGEAMSHLTHLLFQNKITAELRDSVVYYTLRTC